MIQLYIRVRILSRENISTRIFLEDSTMEDVGFRIKSLRKARNVTQKDFAERICVTQSYLSRVETGKEQPTDMLIKFISLEFECSLEWLRDGVSQMDIDRSNFDYWDRTSAEPLKKDTLFQISELSNKMGNIKESAISLSVSTIVHSIIELVDLENKNKSALILSELSDFVSEYISFIERLEKGKNIGVRNALIQVSESITKSIFELYSK